MTYICRWTDETITLDGKLDEAVWQQAERIEKFWVQIDDPSMLPPEKMPQQPSTRTVARLLWSDTHLYLSAEMEDSDIYAIQEGHNPPFGGDDLLELFIKPKRDHPYYWEFHVNPLGATRDYFRARRYSGKDDRWNIYPSGMQAGVFVDGTLNDWEVPDRGWTAELAIPFTAFEKSGGRPNPGDVWTFMVSRYDYSVHTEAGLELITSVPLPVANFHLHEYYADLVFEK